MNIVIIDGNTLNPGDLSWDQLSEFGLVKIYGESAPEDAISKLEHADIVLTNKFVINKQLMQRLPKLKCICVTATGYNIIDVQAATDCGITVCNASGYSTASTAQHTIALLLELTNNCADYDNSVRSGDWTNSGSWTYSRKPTIELAGLTLGIIGFGAIGQQVANIAQVLGMQVIAYKRNPPADGIDGLRFVSLEALYKSADVISMHCPLNAESQEMINEQSLSLMKPSAFLINTARGGLIREHELKTALNNGIIAGAALDVLQDEPPSLDNPLIGLKNCIITPHIAWGSKAARSRLLNISIDNVRSFIGGQPKNVVN